MVSWIILLPLAIWLIFSPYGEPSDILMLVPLVILNISSNGSLFSEWQGWLSIYCICALPFYVELFPSFLLPWYGFGVIAIILLITLSILKISRKETFQNNVQVQKN